MNRRTFLLGLLSTTALPALSKAPGVIVGIDLAWDADATVVTQRAGDYVRHFIMGKVLEAVDVPINLFEPSAAPGEVRIWYTTMSDLILDRERKS